MPTFTFEETEILCMSNGETREEHIFVLERMKVYLPDEEAELKTVIDSVIGKLGQMTDAQFEELKPSLISDYDEQEE